MLIRSEPAARFLAVLESELRAAFDAGFWAWPNADAPSREAARDQYVAWRLALLLVDVPPERKAMCPACGEFRLCAAGCDDEALREQEEGLALNAKMLARQCDLAREAESALTLARQERDEYLALNRELVKRALPVETLDRERQITHLTNELSTAEATLTRLQSGLKHELAAAFEAGHWAWPTTDDPTRNALRDKYIADRLVVLTQHEDEQDDQARMDRQTS